VKLGLRPTRILDFDIERRPLNYLGDDFTYGDITAIAAGWAGEDEVEVFLQTKRDSSRRTMLKRFAELYAQADLVTGHYIRAFDLPVINGAMLELDLPGLGPKLSCDTKLDLVKRQGVGVSQQNLAELLGIEAPKVGMSQVKWREANRLTKAGLDLTRVRCVGDVVQHKQLRLALLERGWLKAPKVWRP